MLTFTLWYIAIAVSYYMGWEWGDGSGGSDGKGGKDGRQNQRGSDSSEDKLMLKGAYKGVEVAVVIPAPEPEPEEPPEPAPEPEPEPMEDAHGDSADDE